MTLNSRNSVFQDILYHYTFFGLPNMILKGSLLTPMTPLEFPLARYLSNFCAYGQILPEPLTLRIYVFSFDRILYT